MLRLLTKNPDYLEKAALTHTGKMNSYESCLVELGKAIIKVSVINDIMPNKFGMLVSWEFGILQMIELLKKKKVLASQA